MENASAAFLDAMRKSMNLLRSAIGVAVIDPTLLKVPAQVSALIIAPPRSPIAKRAMRSTRRVISAAARRAGKGHEQNPARIGAIDDQMGDPVRQRIGLASFGSCDNEGAASFSRTPYWTARRYSGFRFSRWDIGNESAGAGWFNET
jgi:hypothetical protein